MEGSPARSQSRTASGGIATIHFKGAPDYQEWQTALWNIPIFNHNDWAGVTDATLDDAGAFGDWPEDFGQVEMELESSYLDAAEARVSGGRDG